MITVAGFNTAIDRRIGVDQLRPGSVERARFVDVGPGGKGLHVAQVATALGESAALVGLSDAMHDELLSSHLRARGVDWHGIQLPHNLRQCLAIQEADGRMTEILESGDALDAALCESLLGAVESLIPDSDVLVLSGSLPRGFAADTYADIIRTASTHGVRCLLDASGEALRAGIEAQPWLVKPNADEAAALWGHPVPDADTAADCARWLHGQGIARAVITLGDQGAVGFDGEHAWHATLAVDKVLNAVGSGDCFMAGLAVSTARGLSLQDALRCATACGAANAQSEETGYVSKDLVGQLHARVHVRRLGG